MARSAFPGLQRLFTIGLVGVLLAPLTADALGMGPNGDLKLRPAFAAPIGQGSCVSLRRSSCISGSLCARKTPRLGLVKMQQQEQPEMELPEEFNTWSKELAILATGAGVGVTTGAAVSVLKLGIGAIREGLYKGAPAAFMHDLVGGLAFDGFNPEIALFPLVGAVITTTMLLINGANFGGGLAVLLEKVWGSCVL